MKRNERELTQQKVPPEMGKATYREIAGRQIIGDSVGMLKLLFQRHTREVLGVHIMGENAGELVRIGQTALAFDWAIDYFVNSVFKYPTLAECYKNATFDGLNRLAG